MDDSGQRNRIRSVTEPSTPLRRSSRIDQSFAFYSHRQRTIFRTSDIHLPPHELPSIAAKLSQESNSAPGSLRRSRRRSRSRPTTPQTGRDSISGLSSGTLTPTRNNKRRSSSNFTMGNKRRKRRSLIVTENGVTALDPNYIGPITIDYLRLFCKITIEEKAEKENSKTEVHDSDPPVEPQENTPARSPGIGDRMETRNIPIFNDFDQSLPLPDVEGIPVSPESDDLGPLYDPVEIGTPPKTTFSYLERILAAQAKRNQKVDKEPEHSFHKKTSDEGNMQTIGSSSMQTQFIIEDNSAHIKNVPPNDLNIRSNIELDDNTGPKVEESLFVPEESSGIDEPTPYNEQLLDNKQLLDNEQSLDNEQPLEYEQDNNEFVGMNDEYNDIEDKMNISDLSKPDHLSEAISTPTRTLLEFTTHEELEGRSPTSPNAVVNEEYTIDNDFNNDLFEEAFDTNNEHNEIDNSLDKQTDKSTGAPATRITRSNKTKIERSHLPLPINMVKNVVKLLQAAPTRGNSTATNKQRNTQKVKRLTPDIYEFIQQKSDDFILNVVADLEAYSGHRTNNKSNQINIKDVLLYLNRIKFSSGGENRIQEVDNITNLAYKFLPLELLISLDNNLHGRVNRQKPKTYEEENHSESFETDSESDYNNEPALKRANSAQHIRHLKTFSDSETE